MSNHRYGALIKFREGVTEEEIARAMNKIKDVIDLPSETMEPEYGPVNGKPGRNITGWRKVRFTWRHLVQKYNPDHGEPVFYIP